MVHDVTHTDPSQAITLNPGGWAGCSDTGTGVHCVSVGRIVPGMHRPKCASSKGRIVQGTHRPGDTSSRGRIVQETHRPRDASSKNKCLGKHQSRTDKDVLYNGYQDIFINPTFFTYIFSSGGAVPLIFALFNICFCMNKSVCLLLRLYCCMLTMPHIST